MSKYIGLGNPPRAAEWQSKVPDWTMSLNDTLGDCVPAAAAHCVTQWTTYAGDAIVPTDSDVLKAYEDVGGYVQGNPATDNGCNMLDFLKYWRKTGIGGNKIAAFVSVNPTSDTEVRWSIKLFGNLYLGVQLPLTVQGATEWDVPRLHQSTDRPAVGEDTVYQS
jgi:hypothetical protein